MSSQYAQLAQLTEEALVGLAYVQSSLNEDLVAGAQQTNDLLSVYSVREITLGILSLNQLMLQTNATINGQAVSDEIESVRRTLLNIRSNAENQG